MCLDLFNLIPVYFDGHLHGHYSPLKYQCVCVCSFFLSQVQCTLLGETYHKLGVVVPVQGDVGYREVPVTLAELKKTVVRMQVCVCVL